ncbi:UNKNOWN [Stylonychia lemnae]|uniref:Amino acid transporter transmembrane domain-containing protein n=1 Tax=Stylonychia lemnae TaxID=5949 RepID=A0A077ZVD2_STYLE|nr:UNKNOWN [Stylonychia lemnae]|eukprot:CDW73860.1 UNKNOWN [Stylonychia lemnae]
MIHLKDQQDIELSKCAPENFEISDSAWIKGLNTMQAAQAFVSTIIGAGVVSIPYVFAQAGYVVGILMHLVMIATLNFSVHLLLKSREYSGFESYGEIAYICLGRPSVFITNFIITSATSLIVVMYGMLFSNICASFAYNIYNSHQISIQDNTLAMIFTSKLLYIILLFLILLPFVIKKSIKDLNIAGKILFFGLTSLIVLLFAKINFKSQLSSPNDKVVEPYKYGTLADSSFIVMTAYGFMMSFFSIFTQLQVKTESNGFKSLIIGMLACFAIFMILSTLAVTLYGNNLQPNLFDNIQVEANAASLIMRILFLPIFVFNAPFVFLAGKESLLMIIDDLTSDFISNSIKKRLEFLKKQKMSSQNDNQWEAPIFERQDENNANGDLPNDNEVNNQRQHISERMSNKIYYPTAVALFVTQMFLSYVINDITIIIGFFTAIAESSVNFILPGLCFIMSSRMTDKKINVLSLIGSYIYVVIGVCLFFFAMYRNIMKIKRTVASI